MQSPELVVNECGNSQTIVIPSLQRYLHTMTQINSDINHIIIKSYKHNINVQKVIREEIYIFIYISEVLFWAMIDIKLFYEQNEKYAKFKLNLFTEIIHLHYCLFKYFLNNSQHKWIKMNNWIVCIWTWKNSSLNSPKNKLCLLSIRCEYVMLIYWKIEVNQ